MKKIITLLVSVTMVASAFAQFGGGKDPKDNGYGRDQRDNGYGRDQRDNGYGRDQRDNGYGRDQKENGCGNGSYDKGKDVVYNDGKFKDNSFFKDFYVYTAREKDMDIFQINREYDRKIQTVKNRFFMPRVKKDQIIYQLEFQRKDEINDVLARFNSRKNRFDGYDQGSKDWNRHGNDHDQRRNW